MLGCAEDCGDPLEVCKRKGAGRPGAELRATVLHQAGADRLPPGRRAGAEGRGAWVLEEILEEVRRKYTLNHSGLANIANSGAVSVNRSPPAPARNPVAG